ncbi:c-type cytochrome [Adhaeribacter aquaticus]|uniref:c-type cytochrome n=1 Tax=Adhaeribacter aquaticus TaxID=299567 RepID=UPI00041AEB6C|nr:c-type cytochrome [Adhaeribacter aquaticus]
MKKLIFALAACNMLFLASCGSSEKQAGEEYYDPNYKPTENSSASSGNGAQNGTDAQGGTTEVASESETPSVSTEAAPVANAGATATSGTTTPAAGATPTSGTTTPAAGATAAAQPKAAAGGANVEKGKALIGKSDCLACHQIDNKLVGPAYKEVAQKYESNEKNLNFLATKIIKGGAGNWGEVPMSPHPTLSQGDAKEMARYILSLR